MTVATLTPERLAPVMGDRQLSARTVVLAFALVACVLYAIWHRTVPPGAVPHDVDADTMCLIYRFGLGGLCR